MLFFSYVIKHILKNKNKILYELFMHYLLPTTIVVKAVRRATPFSPIKR
jgi:hypothetical protein